MFPAAPRQLPLADQVSIYGWRLVIYAMRHLHRAKIRFHPIYSPIRPYLWVPMVALVVGMAIGFMIALA